MPSRHAHGDRRFADRRVHAQDARQRVPQDGQQRVQHERDDRRVLADAADEREWDQKPEQRQAGDGLHDVSKAEDPPLQRRASGEQDAGRNGDGDGDSHGDADQHEMLQGQVHDLAGEVVR